MTAEVVSIAARQLPHNLEAEQALLGAILVANNALDRVHDVVSADHFFHGAHGRIFAAIAELIEQGKRADPVVLKNRFDADGSLDDIGGQAYLSRLAASAVSIRDARQYAETIRDLYLRRELALIGEDVAEVACDFRVDKPASDLIEQAEQRLYEIAERDDRKTVKSIATAFDVALEEVDRTHREGRRPGYDTGFGELRDWIGGLKPGQLSILAGRPSMGKSALARNIADNISQAGHPVAYFDLENDSGTFALALASRRLKIPYADLYEAKDLSAIDFERLAAFRKDLAKQPLTIDDRSGVTVSYIRNRCRRIKRRGGLALVVIDYLQLLRTHSKYDGNRVYEIAEVTQELKALAKDFNVAVLLLSQLNRKVEEREKKRPQLADLRDSGSIEQDADLVMLIFREEYYLTRDAPEKGDVVEREKWEARMRAVAGKAEVIVAKQRHGKTGIANLSFCGAEVSFGDHV